MKPCWFVYFISVVYLCHCCYAQEECSSRVVCQPGYTVAPNPKHTPSSNGCGTAGFMVKGDEFTVCCNQHDLCYDTCGNKKSDCDLDFKKCMERVCLGVADKKGCQSKANTFFTGTVIFGCHSYQVSQQNACICSRHSEL